MLCFSEEYPQQIEGTAIQALQSTGSPQGIQSKITDSKDSFAFLLVI